MKQKLAVLWILKKEVSTILKLRQHLYSLNLLAVGSASVY